MKDPLDSTVLRHLEKDLFARAGHEVPPSEPAGGITMVWPSWEGGYGDAYMWTVMPLGYWVSRGMLPNTSTLAISGTLYSKLWEPLRRIRNVCVFERGDRYHDVAVRDPLPRCAPSSCYRQVHVCEPPKVSHERSWRGAVELDYLMGLPRLSAAASTLSMHEGVLRVLFAKRVSAHGRNLLNIDSLVSGCPRFGPKLGSSWVLHCKARELGSMRLLDMLELMRKTDVFVSMHGADVINGIHLRPGRSVLEVVNFGFHLASDGAPFYFLNCFWRHLTPTFVHKRLVLANPFANRVPSVDEAWNYDGILPPALFINAVRSVVARDGTPQFYAKANRTTQSLSGYCAITEVGPSDCENGERGSVPVGRSLPDMRACVAFCHRCTRCRFVSYSAWSRDCSWFHSCDVHRLGIEHDGESFVTVRVPKNTTLPKAQVVTTPPSRQDASTAHEPRPLPPPPDSCPYRLLVQTAAQFAGQLTGGLECLVNLAIALGANLPAGCTSVFTGNRLTTTLRQDYPTFSELGERGVEGREELLLRRGDMLVLPEVDDCPTRLVERGVRVWIYQLGTSPACPRLRQGCRFFVHNFWLAQQYGVHVPREMVVRPPINPTHLAQAAAYALPARQRSNVVLINGHDLPKDALETIQAACARTRAGGAGLALGGEVKCEVPHGYGKRALRQLMGRAKVVVAWCMRGTERLPIEAALYGAVLLSNNCAVGSDERDFPLPPQHRLPTAQAIGEAITALLSSNEAYEAALAQQLPLQTLYKNLGPASMAEEARAFLRAAAQPQPAEELAHCTGVENMPP